MFFPAEGPREDRGNFFHGRLYRCIKRKLWSGRKDDPEVRIELNVDPLKWYKLKSGGINRKKEELFNIRKFRNRTVWKCNKAANKIFIITSIYLLVNLVSIPFSPWKLCSTAETVTVQAKRRKRARWTFEVILPHRNLHKSQQITYQKGAN